MPQSPGKNTKEGRAVYALCPFLASQQGWMFFCVSSSFSHLLMVAPPSIISACKESLICHDPGSGPQTTFQLYCPQLTGNFPLGLWIQVPGKEREGEKESNSTSSTFQTTPPCPQVTGKRMEAPLGPGICTITFQASGVTREVPWSYALLKRDGEGFHGGSVVKTLCSQSRGPGFDPWLGNQIPHAATKKISCAVTKTQQR